MVVGPSRAPTDYPIYGGVMALAIGSAIPSRSVSIAAAASALVVWLAIKARWEERPLRERDSGYCAYAFRTPRFILLASTAS
jgi:protein-S-isoprenylcysteine O-methyltransferase Ste14